jgi:prephenate dehydrogenase
MPVRSLAVGDSSSATHERNHVLTVTIHDLAMTLTAEQHAQLAAAYEQAAADYLIPVEQQAAFARKANWFRVLARLAEKNEQAAHQVKMPAELSKPNESRLGSALKRLLTVVR